jgi:hypothetical protein
MSTKEKVKQKVKTSYKYAHVTRRYLRRNYQKVLEIQRRYREAHPEKSREWRREAQRRFYLKNKDKPEYKASKYYSNQKSSFKRYVLNHAEQEELGYFLSVLETKKKNEGVTRPALLSLDDKEVQKMRTVAYRFICLNVEERDYAQVEGFIHEALEKLEQ